MSADTPDGRIVLSPAELLELRAEATELGVPMEPTRIDRPDGELGYGERLASAELLPPQVAAARDRLHKAHAEGDQGEIAAARQNLADVAGLKLREESAAAADPGPVVTELVIADVMNLPGKSRPHALTARELAELYEDTLRLVVKLRAALTAAEQDTPPAPPPPPEIRRGSVWTRNGAAWQFRDGGWEPLITPDDFAGLTDGQRADIEQHAGPLPH